jgi:hypothetical protein
MTAVRRTPNLGQPLTRIGGVVLTPGRTQLQGEASLPTMGDSFLVIPGSVLTLSKIDAFGQL